MTNNLLRYSIRNFIHSAVLIGSMLFLAAMLGWLIWGIIGVIWTTLFSLFFLLVAPSVSPQLLLRIYGAQPISEYEAPDLIQILRELARKAQLPAMPQLYHLPSQMANSFAIGSPEKGAVVVTNGLLHKLTSRELRGVLAHEVGHIRRNDGWVMSLAASVSRMVNVMSWTGQILLFINLPLLLTGDYLVPWFLIILLMMAPTLSALLQLALSRAREFEADFEAARLSGDPRGLASGLVKIEQLSGNWFERILLPGRTAPNLSLLRTHPQTDERVRRLLEIEKELAKEHPGENEDWFPRFRHNRPKIFDQPTWHASRLSS
jgi:heat shock protein HtpX